MMMVLRSHVKQLFHNQFPFLFIFLFHKMFVIFLVFVFIHSLFFFFFCLSKVLEESPIVSEVTFAETAGGQSVPTGQFVSTLSSGQALSGLGVRETREATLAHGKSFFF